MTLKVLCCGGGNGAHTFAATASAIDGIEVNVMTLFADEAERWAKALGDDCIVADVTFNDGSKGVIKGKPKLITKDPQTAMEGVDAVFFIVPAFAHQEYFSAIAKYLKPNTTIVGMPGQAGFEFQALHCLGKLADSCAIICLESLPWATRISEFGRKVQLLGIKESLGISYIPGKGNYKMDPIKLAQSVLGEKPVLVKANNYIAVNLMAGSIMHPPIMYGQWKDWDGKPIDKAPLFYQGVDDYQEKLLIQVSEEILDAAKEIQRRRPDLDMSEVPHVVDWYLVNYVEQTKDKSSLQSCLKTNSAYDGLNHPMKQVEGGLVPDFNNRYLSEDVPFGFVVLKGIAECVDVKTPVMDEIIHWAQKKLGKEYLIGSQLKGKDVPSTRAPQAYGFTSLEDLCKTL